MSSYNFYISVDGGKITSTENVLYADSVEYIVAEFEFDQSWSALLKTAVFRMGELVYAVPLEGDKCFVPAEALKEGILNISVFGVLGTTRATTGELSISVENSGYTPITPTAPTPDPYTYFLESVTESKNSAILSAQEAAVSAQYAEDCKDNCESFSQIASSAADSASIYSEAVADAKTAAEQASAEASAFKTATEEIYNSGLCEVNEIRQLANGKSRTLCFDTQNDLNNWVRGTFNRYDNITFSDLNIGDHLFIKELGAPDYWWSGIKLQPIKPDMSNYYTKEEIENLLTNLCFRELSSSEHSVAKNNGTLEPGCVYFVYEEA